MNSNDAHQVFKQTEDKFKPTALNPLNHLQPDSKLLKVRSNMELPETLKFRHNTGNRAYGFEMTIG
jgi:hypothetical protein